MLADVAPANCSAFEKAASVTATWSAFVLDDAPMPESWCVSRRYLGDLGLDEEAALTAARQTGDLKALRDALVATSDTPWMEVLPGPRCRAVPPQHGRRPATPGGACRGCAYPEHYRHFESVVLAADEPLSECHRTVIGYPLMRFPLEHSIAGELTQAGFHGVRLTPLLDGPVMTVDGVELRAFALSAFTGTKGVCLDQGDAAIYLGRGPRSPTMTAIPIRAACVLRFAPRRRRCCAVRPMPGSSSSCRPIRPHRSKRRHSSMFARCGSPAAETKGGWA